MVAVGSPGRAARAAAVLGSLVMLFCFSPARAGATASGDGGDGPLFSLERARREQQRQATSASVYRSDVPWPMTEDARARWLHATIGGEWDQKKTLLSNGRGEPDEISPHGRGGGTWFVDAGSEIFRADRLAGGLAATYWGEDFEGSNFDAHYPSATAWLDWAIKETLTMRLRYDVGHARVDGDGFATTHTVGPRFYNDWGDEGVTEFSAEVYAYDFHIPLPDYRTEDMPFDGLCVSPPGTPSPDPCHSFDFVEGDRRDRGGWGFVFAGEHRVRFDWQQSEIRAGYHYQHFIPDGAEFHNQSHQVWIEGTMHLPLGFVANANVSLIYQGNRNLPSFGEPSEFAPNRVYAPRGIRRHDRIARTYVAIAREIVPHVSASLEWYFTEHDSNLEVFDYDGHRIGAYVTAYFP
jgi:hypothetical protein